MKHDTWNRVIDLWNAGKTIGEISRRTGIPEPDLGKGLLSAVERGTRVRSNVTRRK
jgi:hypothetical protein